MQLAQTTRELEECRERLERTTPNDSEVTQLSTELEHLNERLSQLLHQFDVVSEQLDAARNDKISLEVCLLRLIIGVKIYCYIYILLWVA